MDSSPNLFLVNFMSSQASIDQDLLSFVSGAGGSAVTKEGGRNEEDVKSSKSFDNVVLDDLTTALQGESFDNIQRRLLSTSAVPVSKRAVSERIQAPLEPQKALELERLAAYNSCRNDMKKWIPVVSRNRRSGGFQNKTKNIDLTSNSLTEESCPRTDFEKGLDKILSLNKLDSEKAIIDFERVELSKITPEELEERYKVLAKKRALLFYAEKKNKWMANIKSKSYRKVVRKEKESQLEAERQGMETDPNKERLLAEFERIKERMTLKTSKAKKWAHDLLKKRRLEPGSLAEVQQQIQDKSRLRMEILQKAANLGDEGSATDPEDYSADELKDSFEDTKVLSEDEDHALDSKETLLENSSLAGSQVGRKKFAPEASVNRQTKKRNNDEVDSLSSPHKDQRAVRNQDERRHKETLEDLKRSVENRNDVSAETRSHLDIIKAAFAGDSVSSEFQMAQQEEIETEAPKSDYLPGWGTWDGHALPRKDHVNTKAPVQEKTNKTVTKVKKPGHVIIHEKQSKLAAKLKIAEPPFPYRSRSEYENGLQNPIGKEWNSFTAFTKKVKPRTNVKAGSLISSIRY